MAWKMWIIFIFAPYWIFLAPNVHVGVGLVTICSTFEADELLGPCLNEMEAAADIAGNHGNTSSICAFEASLRACMAKGSPHGKREGSVFLGTEREVKTVYVGDDVTMSCRLANGSTGHKVTWIKLEGPTVISYTQDPRIRILGDDLTTFDLHISSVRSRDAGTYLCQVNSSPEATKTVVLQIGRVPIIKAVLINNKTVLVETVNEGKTRLSTEISVDESAPALLDCLATAFPPPEVAWTSLVGSDAASRARISRGDMIRGMRLVIGNVTVEDEGLYTCRASNGYGSVDMTVRLTVRYVPRIKPLPGAIHVGLGSYIRISCEADGVPAPEFQWSRDDGKLVSNGRYLVIVDVNPTEYSNYVCSARNAIGAVTASTEITGRPKKPKFLSPTTGSRRHAYKLVLDPNIGTPYSMPLKVDSFVITIREHTTSRENSGMVPSWYEQVVELEDGGTSLVEYVIRDLRANTSYEVMVRGRNTFGAGEGATFLIKTSYAAKADLTTPPGNQVTTKTTKSENSLKAAKLTSKSSTVQSVSFPFLIVWSAASLAVMEYMAAVLTFHSF